MLFQTQHMFGTVRGFSIMKKCLNITFFFVMQNSHKHIAIGKKLAQHIKADFKQVMRYF